MANIAACEYGGHRGVEICSGGSRMIALHSIGPRIAWFGLEGGDNLLFWDVAGEHRRGDWRMYGGHRLWVMRPLADENEETYEPDNAACEVEAVADGVRIVAPPNRLAIEKSIAITARDGSWTIEHRLRNTGELLWSGGAWGLTCTLPGNETVYRIPLGGGPPGWDVATIVIPLRWGGDHSSRLDDPQVALTGDAMEVRPIDGETKRMVFAPRGTLEMRDPQRGLFRKRTPAELDASYPLGTNLAIYTGPRRYMVELETMGPLRTLYPGGELVHREVWTLERP